LRRTVRSHRVLVGAACVVVAFAVVAGVGWIWKGPTSPRATSASARSASEPPTSASPPTTVAGSGALGAPKGASLPSASPTTAKNGAAFLPASASAGSSAAVGTTAPASGATSSSLPAAEVGQSSKIEQTGSLSLVVPKGETAKTMSELTFLAGSYDGFVVSSATQGGADGKAATLSGSITLQVPVDAFATVLTKSQALGKTASLTTKATDVTGQYVDLQSQITALQAGLQQYLTIMTKATTIAEILSVQAQINTIQTQIQQLQGQLQVLTTETTYSTLTVLVNEKAPPVPVVAPKAHSGLAKAWHDSVHGFVDALEGLIRLGGPALFVLVLGAAVVLGVRLAWRRYRRAAL
jgi:hypothetical protein